MSGHALPANGWKAPKSTAGAASRSGGARSEPTPTLRSGLREFSYPLVRPIPDGRLTRSAKMNDPGGYRGRSDNPCAWSALDARYRI